MRLEAAMFDGLQGLVCIPCLSRGLYECGFAGFMLVAGGEQTLLTGVNCALRFTSGCLERRNRITDDWANGS